MGVFQVTLHFALRHLRKRTGKWWTGGKLWHFHLRSQFQRRPRIWSSGSALSLLILFLLYFHIFCCDFCLYFMLLAVTLVSSLVPVHFTFINHDANLHFKTWLIFSNLFFSSVHLMFCCFPLGSVVRVSSGLEPLEWRRSRLTLSLRGWTMTTSGILSSHVDKHTD